MDETVLIVFRRCTIFCQMTVGVENGDLAEETDIFARIFCSMDSPSAAFSQWNSLF